MYVVNLVTSDRSLLAVRVCTTPKELETVLSCYRQAAPATDLCVTERATGRIQFYARGRPPSLLICPTDPGGGIPRRMPKPKKNPTHGGVRPGAGRPPKDEDERTVQVAVSLLPAQLEWVDAQAEKNGISRAEVVRALVAQAMTGPA